MTIRPKSAAPSSDFTIPSILLGFLEKLGRGQLPIDPCSGPSGHEAWQGVDVRKLAATLVERGLDSPLVIAERTLRGIDVRAEAKRLGINTEQLRALGAAAVAALTPEERRDIDAAIAHPEGKGLLPPEHPEVARMLKGIGVEKRLARKDVLSRWVDLEGRFVFLPRGPLRSVDHRPKLGPARDQGARPTCTSFGATVVAEALEYLRDRRPGPRDFSEEYLWWYSKNGAFITAGGYDGRVALYHYEQNGVPSENLLPYSREQINSNHAHVPVSDDAIDRARDYRQPPLALLPERDIEAVKTALRSGRCVTFGSDVENWSTATGVISFPDPLDSRGVGGSHCTTIIGFIDHDDLPSHFEGGYFIVRNSWGGEGSTSHTMGPEYGGHLLMPYGWYRRYTGWPGTLGSAVDPTSATSRNFRIEYFANPSLRGTPARVDSAPDVDFDWGSGGPFDITIPLFGTTVTIPVPPHNQFSARFTQVRRLRSGYYEFELSGDDGVRLWVDDRLVINGWKRQPTTTYTTEHYVSGGDHVLRVEYFEATGKAEVKLRIRAVELHYELFTNTELSGTPAASFDDSMTDFEWRHAPPVGTALTRGRFSLRGTGQKHFEAGTYTFHARHSGGCRLYLDGTLVLDDWDGANGNGIPFTVSSSGMKQLRVEFAHREQLPAAGAKAFYRAHLAFEWAEAAWRGRVHFDPARKDIADAGWPNPDSVYEAFRTQSLTGNPVVDQPYPVPAPAGTAYSASDAASFTLRFPSNASFGTGMTGGAAIDESTSHFSAVFTRRLFVPTSGRYQISLRSDEAFRVMVDGGKVLERRFGGGDPFSNELQLSAGVHDVAIEYADSGWGGKLDFALQPARWTTTYYSGTTLETVHSTLSVVGPEHVVDGRPAALVSNWSARATRQLWLPVGRYRVAVRAPDGLRLEANGTQLVNSWRAQATKSHIAWLEHSGGAVNLELQMFRSYSNDALALEVTPDGFLGEYYRGTTLETPADSSSWARNPPFAYRFEPVIDFDWGGTGRLARVGSDRFSARFWGSVELPVGRWQFSVTSDDGVRLFLDDRLLINRWVDQPASTQSAIIDLAGGRRELRVEYYERTGSARCQLKITRIL